MPTPNNYATIADLTTLWRPMTAEEQTRATQLLTIVSAELRTRANRVNMDLDEMAEDDDYALVLKSTVSDITARVLMTSTNQEPMSQFSQSAGGYSVSGTYLTPGGGLFIKKSELARLGIKRQKWGAIDVFD